MERIPRTTGDASQLLQLSKLLEETTNTVIDEWSQERYATENVGAASGTGSLHERGGRSNGLADNPRILPSWRLHQAQRTILGIAGVLTELVSEPYDRLQEFAAQFWEARALAVATERRIPNILAETGDKGMEVQIIAKRTGIEQQKLSRLLRCLCSNHIFRQVEHETFANNRISAALVNNEEFRAYIMIFHLDVYTASDRFPKYLLGPRGDSYDVAETSFQDALGTSKPRWEWLAERVKPNELSNDGVGYPGVSDIKNWSHLVSDEEGKLPRPELENFSLAMVGNGKVSGAAHPFDWPWGELPHGATVVDVGGGMGGFCEQLLSTYPHLNCIVQDRAEVIDQARRTFWPKAAPELLGSGRLKLQVHDFFQPNPVKGADVYWFRGVLHDWSDEYFIRILAAIRGSMSETSCLLICDQVMNTTHGCNEIERAPLPLPANYGYYARYCHTRDISLMGIINGIERTPTQFKDLVEKADLKLHKIWETRTLYGVVEVRK